MLIYGTEAGFNAATILAIVGFLTLLLRVFLLFEDLRKTATALKVAHAAAERLSRTDPLTAAANQRAFTDMLNQVKIEDGGIGILMVDIDLFKRINDQYGHDVGNKVICAVTQRITAAIRANDAVGRWGGEEFCVLLVGIRSVDDVRIVAEKMRASISRSSISANEYKVNATVSIGAYFVSQAPSWSAAINAADEQLYAAKRGGRNQVAVSGGPAGVRPLHVIAQNL